jgi:hypothetical protein
MYIDILTLLAVVLLAAVLSLYNRRQAESLRGMERMVQDFLALQLRDRRDARAAKLDGLQPRAWLEKLLNRRVDTPLSLGDTLRTVPEVFAAEISVPDANRKVIFSSLPLADLKRYDKSLRQRKGDSASARIANLSAKPLIGRKKPTVLEISMVAEGQYFDLEAEFVGNALGVQWQQLSRLWAYVLD